MADLTVTADNVTDASPHISIKLAVFAAVAINKGQAVYINSSGKAALADASASGTGQVTGIAMRAAQANQAVEVLIFGMVDGYDLSSVAYDTIVSLSDTAGAIDNGAGSPTVTAPMGKVFPITDSASSPGKVLFIDCTDNLTTARS